MARAARRRATDAHQGGWQLSCDSRGEHLQILRRYRIFPLAKVWEYVSVSLRGMRVASITETEGQLTNPRSLEPAIDMMNIDLHLRIRDGQVESIERIGSDMFVGKVEQILRGLRKSGWIVIKRDLLAEKLATW